MQKKYCSRIGYRKSRDGYTFLLSVLFAGAIATVVMGSIMLLSWRSMRNGEVMHQSNAALAEAMLCAEHALLSLHNNSYYSGDETLDHGDDGECYILPVGGSGNENRTVCTEGMYRDSVRRTEVIIQRLLPSVRIFSWNEVENFTTCSY